MADSFLDQPLDIWSLIQGNWNKNPQMLNKLGGSQMPPPQFLQPPVTVPAPVAPAVPQSAMDPAQASAQGYRIPGYTPPSSGGIGSDAIASKVPVPQDMSAGGAIPPPRGGIGSDFVAGGGAQQPSDTMTTSSVAHPENDMFSFFGKPQATDAMTAFGAAMLKGKTFSDGLADASKAVNEVSQKYRPYSQEELQRMVQEAEIKRLARAKALGTQVEWSRPLYDDKGQLYYPAQDQNGGTGFYNSSTGKIEPSISGGLRAEDSTKKYESKQNVKDATTARDAAVDSYTRINQADQLLELYDSAGGGAGALNQIGRDASKFFNTDILGVKVGDTQRIENIVRQMELTQAQTQRGLGQLTEAERQIIRDALPKLDQDPEAFKTVVQTLKRQSERARTVYTNWASDKALQQKYPNINDYYLSFMESQGGKPSSAPSSQSGNKPSLDDIFK